MISQEKREALAKLLEELATRMNGEKDEESGVRANVRGIGRAQANTNLPDHGWQSQPVSLSPMEPNVSARTANLTAGLTRW